MVIKTKPITNHKLTKSKAMKIELTITELLLLVDMIKNGTEQDNEGDDFYLMQDFLDGDLHHNCAKCNATMDKTTKEK
jgi:hypothetical protein